MINLQDRLIETSKCLENIKTVLTAPFYISLYLVGIPQA